MEYDYICSSRAELTGLIGSVINDAVEKLSDMSALENELLLYPTVRSHPWRL